MSEKHTNREGHTMLEVIECETDTSDEMVDCSQCEAKTPEVDSFFSELATCGRYIGETGYYCDECYPVCYCNHCQ